MIKMKILGIVTLVAGLSITMPALAQTTWTMVSGYPEHSFFTKNIHKFIDEVEQKTDSQLKIGFSRTEA